MDKKLISVIIVIIAAVGVFGFWQYQKTKVEAKEFAGKVVGVQVQPYSITVEGVYVVPGRPDLSGPDKKKTVTVLVDAQSRLIKERLYLPSAKDVEKTGGRYDPSKLRRDEVVGSLEDLKGENVSVRAIAVKNIYKKSSFIASEIRYIEPVFP